MYSYLHFSVIGVGTTNDHHFCTILQLRRIKLEMSEKGEGSHVTLFPLPVDLF